METQTKLLRKLFLKKVFELVFGEHAVHHTENSLLVIIPQLVDHLHTLKDRLVLNGHLTGDAPLIIHHLVNGHTKELGHFGQSIHGRFPFPLFDLNINALSSTAPLSKPNKFKFGGKERQDEFDLNWDDFGARNYDPQLGRWFNIDPLASKYMRFSPYTYAVDNPIFFVDPDGREIDLSDLSKEDRKQFRKTVRQTKRVSKTFREVYRGLKRSDNVYKVSSMNSESSSVGSFIGNTYSALEFEDEQQINIQSLPDDFEKDEFGGKVALNFSFGKDMIHFLGKKDGNAILGATIVEELLHAAQYEKTVSEIGNNNDLNFSGSTNKEFEAKAIKGQIAFEVGRKRSLEIMSYEQTAQSFGLNAFKTKSVTGFHGAASAWRNQPNLPRHYQVGTVTKHPPSLLISLINK